MGISRRPHLRAHNRIEHPHRDLKPRTIGVIQPPTSVRAATTSNLADDGHFLAEERVPPITNPTNSRPVLRVTGTCTMTRGRTRRSAAGALPKPTAGYRHSAESRVFHSPGDGGCGVINQEYTLALP